MPMSPRLDLSPSGRGKPDFKRPRNEVVFVCRPDRSIVDLDLRLVAGEGGQGLDGAPDGAAVPEAIDAGADDDVAVHDADLDVSGAVADGVLDLGLQPTLQR